MSPTSCELYLYMGPRAIEPGVRKLEANSITHEKSMLLIKSHYDHSNGSSLISMLEIVMYKKLYTVVHCDHNESCGWFIMRFYTPPVCVYMDGDDACTSTNLYDMHAHQQIWIN